MCDCYQHKCEGCDNTISLHVADFCTKRSNIHVYCPLCLAPAPIGRISSNPNPLFYKGRQTAKVFADTVSTMHDILDPAGTPVGRRGQVVVILCDDPDAYGIHLN